MFAFYDFETTGISPKFDQAIQFAAALTDDDFNTIEEVNFRCRLADHVLPSPIALAVTGVRPAELLHQDLSLYEFSREIAALIERWAPAVWTGYNSLTFDENFLRQLFYQNLDPVIYRTQFDGNSRLDILRLVYACWAFETGALQIPVGSNGKFTSKLDQLAPLNGFSGHDAHDALGDVRATIFVANLIRQRAPAVWAQVIENADRDRLKQNLEAGQIYHLVERFGAAPPRIYTGAYCGTNSTNNKRIGFFDLASGQAEVLMEADPDIASSAVSQSPKVVREIDIGSMPMLFPATDISEEQQRTATKLANNLALHRVIGDALSTRFEAREEPDFVEAKIYSGFYSGRDKELLRAFHTATWPERSAIVAELKDPRLVELGNRLMAQYAPESVSKDVNQSFWSLVAGRWDGTIAYGESDRKPGNTYQSVAEDLVVLQKGKGPEISLEDLEELTAFFEQRRF